MKKRIKELAADARGQMIVLTTVDDEQWKRHEEFVEKFAKLIVKDVLKIVTDPVNYNNCVYTTFDADRAACVAHALSNKIKEHFEDTQ